MLAASLRSAAGGFRSDTGGLASLVRRSAFVAIGFRKGRDTDFGRDLLTHTIKTVLNDQSGSVRKVLSVRHRRTRFDRPPIGFVAIGFRFGRDGTDDT